jgi:putative acetyltransferase
MFLVVLIMITVRPSRPEEASALYELWHDAVVATHTFVDADDLAYFADEVRAYLPTAELWVAVQDANIAGFMALTDANVDALFVEVTHHGQGVGRALIEHAASIAGALTVDVNEQNVGACAFYARMSFEQVGRDELDDYGKPYPVLHLAQPSAA